MLRPPRLVSLVSSHCVRALAASVSLRAFHSCRRLSSAPAAGGLPRDSVPAPTLAFYEDLYRSGGDVFTSPQPNVHLQSFLARFSGPLRVCVPLCGRSADLAALAARPGTAVLGVDACAAALERWAAENGGVDAAPGGALRSRRHPALRLLCTDIFSVAPALAARFDVVFDRGGVSAVPADMRPRYLDLLRAMLAPPRATGATGAPSAPGSVLVECLVCNLSLEGALSREGLAALLPDGRIVADIDCREEYPDFDPPGLLYLREVVLQAEAARR